MAPPPAAPPATPTFSAALHPTASCLKTSLNPVLAVAPADASIGDSNRSERKWTENGVRTAGRKREETQPMLVSLGWGGATLPNQYWLGILTAYRPWCRRHGAGSLSENEFFNIGQKGKKKCVTRSTPASPMLLPQMLDLMGTGLGLLFRAPGMWTQSKPWTLVEEDFAA